MLSFREPGYQASFDCQLHLARCSTPERQGVFQPLRPALTPDPVFRAIPKTLAEGLPHQSRRLPLIHSNVAFTAVTSIATIGLYISYVIPTMLRLTIGRKDFVPGAQP